MLDVKITKEAVDEITKVGLKDMAETICLCLIDNLKRKDLFVSGNKYVWEDIFCQLEDLARINQILGYAGEEWLFPVDFIKFKKSKAKTK